MRPAVLAVLLLAARAPAADPVYLGTEPLTGGASAVVTPGGLIHTAQVLPFDPAGKLVGKGDPAKQVARVFELLDDAILMGDGYPGGVVKLNLYVTGPEVVAVAKAAIEKRWPAGKRPAVSVVVGKLAHPDALIAADGVASDILLDVGRPAGLPKWAGAHAKRLSGRGRVHVSGQAEKGATPAEAARKTLASLRATLKWMGLGDEHVVQVKSFLTPISAAGEVEKEMAAHFGKGKVPPLVFVEWDSNLPIEIELIASVPDAMLKDVPAGVEFLTPPGMTASPVYARVTRVVSDRVVYTAGLYAPDAGDGGKQVAGVFARADDLLKKTGSDFRHLAKATYYVSDEDASRKLNELRPRFYDPKRPPAASKAKVAGTGMPGRTLTLDLIAVPK